MRLAPGEFLQLGLDHIAREHNEINLTSLLANMQIAFRWYLPTQVQQAVGQALDEALIDSLLHAPTAELRMSYFRTFTTVALSQRGMIVLKDLLNQHLNIPGIPLGPADRQRILQRLTLLDDGQCASLIEAERRQLGGDTRRFLFVMQAAARNAKAQQFAALRADATLAEAWMDEALLPFNAPEHADLTIAFLPAALTALPELKRERNIFFVNRWLAAFIGGQHGSDALLLVRNFLDMHPTLEADLHRKVEEAAGELERTVRIRNKGLQ